jgi:predicted RNase H-like HicB family nuclease
LKQSFTKAKNYYIIHVNELPGICTHNENLNQGMVEIKEAIACAVEIYQESGLLDNLVDNGLRQLRLL